MGRRLARSGTLRPAGSGYVLCRPLARLAPRGPVGTVCLRCASRIGCARPVRSGGCIATGSRARRWPICWAAILVWLKSTNFTPRSFTPCRSRINSSINSNWNCPPNRPPKSPPRRRCGRVLVVKTSGSAYEKPQQIPLTPHANPPRRVRASETIAISAAPFSPDETHRRCRGSRTRTECSAAD